MRTSILALMLLATPAWSASSEKATFAGGCFWCMESAFEGLPGVSAVVSGYTGGSKKDPTYHEVSGGGTGHAESVEVTFDPAKTSYAKLLEVYWRNVDPTRSDGQFCDGGRQYRPAIFTHGAAQAKAAKASLEDAKKALKVPGPIVVEIAEAATFYPAEEYHQDYYKKNPIRYRFYRKSCGRDARLAEVWGKAPAH